MGLNLCEIFRTKTAISKKRTTYHETILSADRESNINILPTDREPFRNQHVVGLAGKDGHKGKSLWWNLKRNVMTVVSWRLNVRYVSRRRRWDMGQTIFELRQACVLLKPNTRKEVMKQWEVSFGWEDTWWKKEHGRMTWHSKEPF